MGFNKKIKIAMEEHKSKIELLQWSIINGVASYVYPNYLMKLKHIVKQREIIFCPNMKSVSDFLNPDGEFIKHLSYDLIDEMHNNHYIQKYIDIPELILFKPENIELLKTIFDLYIIPNIQKSIVSSIIRKFSLNKEDNQIFFEDRDLNIFEEGYEVSDKTYEYIVEESILQLIQLLPSLERKIMFPPSNMDIKITDNEILTISCESAMCPIQLNKEIINNEDVRSYIPFVTNTEIEDVDTSGDEYEVREGTTDPITFKIRSGNLNQIVITSIIGVKKIEENIKINE